MLATYYCTWRQQCGLQTAGLDVLGLYVGNLRAGANLRHLGSVCWQPTTALGGNNVGFKLQGCGQLEASWVCVLAYPGEGVKLLFVKHAFPLK